MTVELADQQAKYSVGRFLTRYSYAVQRLWHRCYLSVCLSSVTDVLWLAVVS